MSSLITDTSATADIKKLLSENVIDSLGEYGKIAKNEKDFDYLKEWLKDPIKWKYPRVSFDTFLDNQNYLGVGDKIYPEIRRMARDIVEGGYTEGVIVAGIGSGKTTSAELIACYATHELLCLRDPHHTYSLAKDKPIAIMNMGTTATQALEVTFAGIKAFIEKSPWFGKNQSFFLERI